MLNRPAQVNESQARQQHSEEWGVDPITGKHDASATISGLTPAQIDALARQPAVAGEPRAVFRRRRYLDAGGTEPMPKWLERGFTANVNRDVSSPHEVGALAATGATPNNAAGNRLEHTHTESFDGRGRPVASDDPNAVGTRTTTTRPDGTRPNAQGGLDIIEHKHLMDGESVLHDSQQLRAQRELAITTRGTTELILSSSAPLVGGKPPVQPSSTVASETGRVYYHDAASGRITHQWTGRGWRRVP